MQQGKYRVCENLLGNKHTFGYCFCRAVLWWFALWINRACLTGEKCLEKKEVSLKLSPVPPSCREAAFYLLRENDRTCASHLTHFRTI